MARCHLKLVMMLLPLWPATPALAQSASPQSASPQSASPAVPSPPAPDRTDLIITEQGAVVHTTVRSISGKNTDRVPQSLAASQPPDVQMAFAPTMPRSDERSPAFTSPCPSAPGPSTPDLSPSEAKALVRRVAEDERFYPDFVMAVAKQESQFKVAALSEKGAYGLMQLMPATAKQFDIDRCVPEANVRGGIRFLRELHQRYRNPLYVLAAYNAGETALQDHGGIPPFPETVAYVAAVLNDFYGYPGIRAAAAGPSRSTDNRAMSQSSLSAQTKRPARIPALPAKTTKPGDWLVLHVE
jgi:soluble lytic murein transglycosylase-like protein